jgi:hypothetical protein
MAACQAGYSVYFTSIDDLVRKLRTAEIAGRLSRQLQVYLRPAVLVIDEVGYLPLDRAEANLVFQLVSRRYERGSIILTSNKTFAKAHMFERTCVRRRRNLTGSAIEARGVPAIPAGVPRVRCGGRAIPISRGIRSLRACARRRRSRG